MSDIETLRSYLVDLGFKVNTSQYKKFLDVLKDAADFTENKTVKIASNLLKWETAVVGMFTAVSGAVVASLDKVAMADQTYRLMGERMFMDTNHARALKVALDALGQPLEAIAFDPELHGYFMQLQKDQKSMAMSLGPDFETNMQKIRQIRFEFTRLKVEAQYFMMGAANQIFKQLGLGSGNFLQTLQNLNNYIQEHLPEWTRAFATYIVPILKDTWMIAKDVWKIFKDLANLFTNVVAMLSGDSGLTSSTFSFEKFAFAVDKVAHAVAMLVHWLLQLQDFFIQHPTLGGAATGALLGSVAGPEGAAIGGIAGGTVGLATSLFRGAHSGFGSGNSTTDVADRARELAQEVSQRIGVPADIIFAQWAHETGNFTNRGAMQLNNLAGIKDGLGYRKFGSLDEFASYYGNLISSKRYASQGALGATNTDQFAAALKAGGYYADSYANYSKGMRNMEPLYSGGNHSSSITVGDINIMQPNATPDQIKNSVLAAALAARDKQTQRDLAQLTPVYP